MTCGITGVSGYVGSRLSAALARTMDVVPISRRAIAGGIQWDLEGGKDIAPQLRERGVTSLVHAAWDFRCIAAKENERINVEGSRRLFDAAERAGVERIVFISTISAFDGARSMYGQSKMRVEKMVLEGRGGIVIRPGLVWGDGSGGMFGALKKQVDKGGIMPLIGSGCYPQYLVHEDDLGDAVLQAVDGSLTSGVPVTIAHPHPWPFAKLIAHMAEAQRKKLRLVAVPWRFVYLGLKIAETIGLKSGFRSDSVVSLVFQNPAPDFNVAKQLGLRARPYLIQGI